MIKLNNKNITYVALADSSNSLKAPKEIWYADSSNSVKLVYRRKDALIEGEDYEKYHWLVSNSEDSQTPYIDTLIPPDLNQNIAFSFKVIDSDTNGGEPGIYGAVLPSSWHDCVIRCFKHTNYDYIILEYNNNNDDFPRKEDMLIKNEFSEGKEYDCSLSINSSTTALGVINNESKGLVANSNVRFVLDPQPTHKLFVQTNNTSWSFNSVGFKKFNITNLISLVPCKLLKPVPKWLDANGIRRNIGECGMIDLVSGKFYGNVNSVGTFTVENYYERKEWLVGDGSAYIDTLHLANEGLGWETHVSNLSFKKHFVWNRLTNNECPAIALYHSVVTNGTVRVQNNYTNSIVLNNQTNYDYIVALNSNGAVINGVQYIGQSTSENISNKSIKLFYCDIDASSAQSITNEGTNSQDVKCAYFRFLDSNRNYIQNLIPCTLTMDLPASMDANNIARTKGTSGMWDLVSDRFYGNVANSGTFKAVNLAEGVDYEVHQWLVANTVGNTSPYNVAYFSQSTESLIGKVVELNFGEQFRDYDFVLGDGYILKIFKYSDGRLYIRYFKNNGQDVQMSCNDSSGKVIVDFANNIVYCDNDSLSFNSYSSASIRNNTQSHGLQKVYGQISCDGLFNYIPVKLLRSIPSKYDANGIARQAGECGMYDTVNDVFYGNVANSGTFSVSDDE